VRNVLLQQQHNHGLVAKLIGFGPLAEDMDRMNDQSGAGVSLTLLITIFVFKYNIKLNYIFVKEHIFQIV